MIIEGLPAPVLDALRFEKSNWAVGSVLDDPLLPMSARSSPADSWNITQTREGCEYRCIPDCRSNYLFCIVYQSEKFDSTPIPVSACILWPYAARSQPDGVRSRAFGP